jgi:hypothetical protein
VGALRAGIVLDGKTKATGFYREDAARIVSEAARLPQAAPDGSASKAQPQPVEPRAPAISIDEPQRPLLKPEPALNQNLRARRDTVTDEPERRWNVARAVAWIVFAPWYVAMVFVSLGVDALFIEHMLHL